MFRNPVDILWSIPALLIAIVFHEVGHGFVSYLMGDSTAKDDGRLSLNPLNHLDPIGLLFMVLFRFGWAKAVPINPYRYKNRKLGIFLVSIAGVVTNFIIALLASPLFILATKHNWVTVPFFSNLLWYNVMLGVFNLVPIPPLDGSKILSSILPFEIEDFFYQYEREFQVLLFILVLTGIISRVIGPIIYSLLDLYLRFGWMIAG